MKSSSDAKSAPLQVPRDPHEAFKRVVYTFGVDAMAAELLMKKGTLYNKCDADAESFNQPTLRDIVGVTRVSGDTRILDSLDRMFNRAAYDVTTGLDVSDGALLELLCRVGSEQGQMHQALLKGFEDRRFCRDDLAAVRGEAFDLITAVLTFLQRVEGMVDE